MQLPKPKMLTAAKRQMVTTFYGLDNTDRCSEDTSDGESYFSAMQNGGSDSFPFAASRCGRETVKALDNPANGLLGTDKLAYVDGQKLIYDGREVLTALIDGEKRLVAFGASILVYPDQKGYNTATGEIQIIGSRTQYTEKITLERIDFTAQRDLLYIYGDFAIYRGEYCDGNNPYDTRRFGFSLRNEVFTVTQLPDSIFIYDEEDDSYGQYMHVRAYICNNTLYYPTKIKKIKYAGKGSNAIEVSIVEWEIATIRGYIISASDAPSYISDTEKRKNLWYGDERVSVSDGDGSYYISCSNPLKIYNTMEKEKAQFSKINTYVLDHVCVLDNRVWGCRYGDQVDSTQTVNSIYCSALGDFKKWDTLQGISTDPWYAGVAEPGPFTGAVAYGGHPIFFKEDCAYVISGSYPPYTVTVLHIDGVARGAARSICEVDGALYYKSRYAVMRYTSSSIGSVSDRLGRLPDAVSAAAGSFGGKYYLSLAGKVHVYDTKRGMWCTEDDCGAVDFAKAGGKLYIAAGKADANGKYPLYEVSGDAEAEADMPWSFTTPRIGYSLPNRKYVSRVLIRLEIGDAALPTVELSRDGGAWETLPCAARAGADGARTGSITIPIRPRRCESFRIRVSGVGAYKLTGITKYMEESGR